MSNQGQGLHSHFIKDLYVVRLYKAQISDEQLQDHWDGQLSYPQCSWASLPEAGYQYLAPILSPLTDKCSS